MQSWWLACTKGINRSNLVRETKLSQRRQQLRCSRPQPEDDVHKSLIIPPVIPVLSLSFCPVSSLLLSTFYFYLRRAFAGLLFAFSDSVTRIRYQLVYLGAKPRNLLDVSFSETPFAFVFYFLLSFIWKPEAVFLSIRPFIPASIQPWVQGKHAHK